MDYAQVEEKFKTLKLQFLTGALDEASFKTQLEQLMVQDEGERWWMIGYETGHWYVHDGSAWVRSEPPRPAPPKPLQEEKVKFSPGLIATVEKAKFGGGEPVRPLPPMGEKIKLGPLPQAQEVKKMGWSFWLRWLGAAGVGGVVFIAIATDYRIFHQIGDIWTPVIPLSIIGILQWLIMRQYFDGSGWWAVLNIIYAGIVGLLVNSYNSYPYNSTAQSLAIGLTILYPIFNLIAGPVWVARKRRSS